MSSLSYTAKKQQFVVISIHFLLDLVLNLEAFLIFMGF